MEKKGLKNLWIYKKACELEIKVHNLVKEFPREEKFRKVDQLKRSSSSTCDNIAESYGKHSYQSKIQSCYTARGEAEETRSQLERAMNLNITDNKVVEGLVDEYTELIKGINGYVKYLRIEKKKKEALLSPKQLSN